MSFSADSSNPSLLFSCASFLRAWYSFLSSLQYGLLPLRGFAWQSTHSADDARLRALPPPRPCPSPDERPRAAPEARPPLPVALALARPLLEGCFGLSPPGRTWSAALPPPPPPPPPQTKPAFGLRVEEKQLHPSRTLGHCHPRLPLMLDPPTKPTCLSVAVRI